MGNCGKPKGECKCGQKTYMRNRMKVGPMRPIPDGTWRSGPIRLAVNNPRRFDGETFNAESATGGRTIRWNNKADAERRAREIRRRGFTARVVSKGRGNNVVYVGPLQKRYQGMRMKPRATYDWSGTQGMSQRDLRLDY
jgi:hypothetical protein